MRGPLPGRLPAEEFFLLGPVSSDGLRSVDLSREPARHRSVPAIDEQQALPHGVPRSRGALHAGGSQRVARLAHLCRFRASPHRHCATAVCPRCLLYTSDAADDLLCVDLGGRRIIKKKKNNKKKT